MLVLVVSMIFTVAVVAVRPATVTACGFAQEKTTLGLEAAIAVVRENIQLALISIKSPLATGWLLYAFGAHEPLSV